MVNPCNKGACPGASRGPPVTRICGAARSMVACDDPIGPEGPPTESSTAIIARTRSRLDRLWLRRPTPRSPDARSRFAQASEFPGRGCLDRLDESEPAVVLSLCKGPVSDSASPRERNAHRPFDLTWHERIHPSTHERRRKPRAHAGRQRRRRLLHQSRHVGDAFRRRARQGRRHALRARAVRRRRHRRRRRLLPHGGQAGVARCCTSGPGLGNGLANLHNAKKARLGHRQHRRRARDAITCSSTRR